MSKVYYRTPQMTTGNGFRCYNCNQELAKKLMGSVYEVTLECRRCHAEIIVRVKEPIPFIARPNEQALSYQTHTTHETKE